MSDVIAIAILCVVTFFLVLYGPCLVNVCERAQPTPDQLYGCTVKQQMPNGDCP